MNWKKTSTALIASITLLTTILPAASLKTLSLKGPRTRDLLIYFYSTTENAYTALQTNAIDIMAWPLNYFQYLSATSDPDIVVASYSANDMFGFPLNLNETIQTYSNYIPKIVSPMTYLDLDRPSPT